MPTLLTKCLTILFIVLLLGMPILVLISLWTNVDATLMAKLLLTDVILLVIVLVLNDRNIKE